MLNVQCPDNKEMFKIRLLIAGGLSSNLRRPNECDRRPQAEGQMRAALTRLPGKAECRVRTVSQAENSPGKGLATAERCKSSAGVQDTTSQPKHSMLCPNILKASSHQISKRVL